MHAKKKKNVETRSEMWTIMHYFYKICYLVLTIELFIYLLSFFLACLLTPLVIIYNSVLDMLYIEGKRGKITANVT